MRLSLKQLLIVTMAMLSATVSYAQMNIVINAGPTLASNPPALAAFNRAADKWETYLTDPITVTIGADLSTLPPNVLGSASPVILEGLPYDSLRTLLQNDAGSDELINNAIPSSSSVSAVIPAGFTLAQDVRVTKANLKALGITGLDQQFGANDSDITFSSNIAFDYDASNGISSGTIDFETVAAHEIGHALGFVSEVDYIDFLLSQNATGTVKFTPLDLFRFSTTSNPTNTAEFTNFPRALVPGGAQIFDDLQREVPMSTGSSIGDGQQASHWKDDALGSGISSLMDPTLGSDTEQPLTFNDLRAMDLIGYDFNVLLGDVNEDGSVNGADINPFIDLLSSSNLSQNELIRADANRDGVVNGADINPFIDLLSGGPSLSSTPPASISLDITTLSISQDQVTIYSSSVIPEPSASLLCMIGGCLTVACRRKTS